MPAQNPRPWHKGLSLSVVIGAVAPRTPWSAPASGTLLFPSQCRAEHFRDGTLALKAIGRERSLGESIQQKQVPSRYFSGSQPRPFRADSITIGAKSYVRESSVEQRDPSQEAHTPTHSHSFPPVVI
jgi:hypothetical protein